MNYNGMILLLLSLTWHLIYGENNEEEKESSTLRLINILYRHGDRSPIKFYSNDPYKDKHEKYWPEGLGQLTKRGKYMEYELGAWLRKRYKNFISSVFVPEEINVFSTDVDRTLMSAECVLAAFYYPNNDTKFENLIWWTPTPIHTAPLGTDKILNVDNACPRIDLEEEKAKNLPAVKKYLEKQKDLFEYVSNNAGQKIDTVREAQYLFDTLKIEKLYGLKLPGWAADKYADLKMIGDFCFQLSTYSKELRRLRGGPLLKTIRDNMRRKISGDIPERKLFMFSAHDSTVAALLHTMDIFNNFAPPYASTVLIELHEINGQFLVKTFYQNDTSLTNAPHLLAVPGCTEECPFSKWSELLREVIPSDWDKECSEDESSRDYYYLLLFTGLFYASGVVLVALVALGLTLLLLKKCGLVCASSRDRSGYQRIGDHVVVVTHK